MYYAVIINFFLHFITADTGIAACFRLSGGPGSGTSRLPLGEFP